MTPLTAREAERLERSCIALGVRASEGDPDVVGQAARIERDALGWRGYCCCPRCQRWSPRPWDNAPLERLCQGCLLTPAPVDGPRSQRVRRATRALFVGLGWGVTP